jgi:hypothetical protein
MAMPVLASALPELSTGIEFKLANFLPAPATVFNVALAFTFFVTIQHCRTNPLTLAMNAFGGLFPSTKPKEILVQVHHVSRVPTLSSKVPPTPTAQYRYQPKSTSNILYAIALCVVFVLVGAIVIVLRKRSTANASSSSSSVDPQSDIGSARQALNGSSSPVGDIPEHFGFGDDKSDKNAPGFLEKFKTFLIVFFILTSFTHGGRIAQKIQSLANRDFLPFSSNNAIEPYFYQAPELVTTMAAAHFDDFPATFTGGNILVSEIVETLTFNILYSSTPSSSLPAPSIPPPHLSSVSLLPLPTMTSNLTSAYPIGLSLVATTSSSITPSPTTTSSSKAALDLAFEYIKLFILFFFFCILIPILFFLITVLPAYFDYVQLSKVISADQQKVISIHFSSHELLLIKVSAESCQYQRGCSRDRGR